MKSKLFILFWFFMVFVLLIISFKFQDRDKGMVAQVENDMTAISYENAVRIKDIYVVPGQHVDSGDLLMEVDQPEIISEIRRLETEKYRLEGRLSETVSQYFMDLDDMVSRTNLEIDILTARKKAISGEGGFDKVNTNPTYEMDLTLIDQQISDLRQSSRRRNSQMKNLVTRDTAQIQKQIRGIDELLAELNNQTSFRVAIAKFDGIIGSIDVQLDELIPPYTTVLTMYGGQPTIIKAYASERTARRDLIGSQVTVKSKTRKYSVQGRITEIGQRIVQYPEMLNPQTETVASYGQEIFVKIPEDNQFLNGEKVYVYLTRSDE